MNEPLILTRTQNTDEYIAELKLALDKNMDCGTTHYNLAVALVSKGLWEEAKGEFLAAIQSSPSLAEAYVDLGGLYFQQGDVENCIRLNLDAIKVRPKFSVPYGNVGFAYLQKGDVDAAIDILEKAVEINPQFVQAQTTLASAYFMKGRVEDSIAASLKALELAPHFGVAHNNLALGYLEKGEHRKAIQHLDLAAANGFAVDPEFLKELEPYRSKDNGSSNQNG